MPHYLADGSMISNSISLGKKKTYYQRRRERYGKVKARVDEVIFSDDPRNSTYNTTSPQVEYICTILGGNEAGRKVFNVKSVVPMGGGSPYNNGEIVHTPTLAGDNNKEGDKAKSPEKTTGSIVTLEWLHAHEDHAIITGSLKHPKSTVAAKTADGYRTHFEYGGMSVSITKDGTFSISFGGGQKDAHGEAADTAGAGSSISFGSGGTITIDDGGGQKFVIDKANGKIELISGQDMNMTVGSNWAINVSGNANINASGSMTIGGSTTSIGGSGGMNAARMGDQVFGTDGMGSPINAFIGIGSSTVLVGG